MNNTESVIVNDPWEVKHRLAKIGLAPEIIKEIAFEAHSARSDSLEIDPHGTAGTWSYQFGVRTTRLKLIPKGWRMARPGGVEATVNDDLAVQICFQNVDKACKNQNPKSISAKGTSARNLVKCGQRDLFDNESAEVSALYGKAPIVWVICVSSTEDSFCVEVSCPLVFEGNQFEGFKERIFVVEEGNTPEPRKLHDDQENEIDFDIKVTKK